MELSTPASRSLADMGIKATVVSAYHYNPFSANWTNPEARLLALPRCTYSSSLASS